MKIVSKLIRAGGTKVSIGSTEYHFKPESSAEGAPHVAEVTDAAHIQRFLSITEGYAPAEGAGEEAQGIVNQSNELTELEQRAIPNAFDLDQLTTEELREQYKACYGRLPPPLATHETIAKKVAAYRLQKAVHAPVVKVDEAQDDAAQGENASA